MLRALVVVALLLAPLAVAEDPPLTLLASASLDDHGSFAARFTTPGALVVARMHIERPSTPFMASFLLFDASGEAIGGFHFTNLPRGGGAHVDVASGTVLVDTHAASSQETFDMEVRLEEHVGTERIVLWLSGSAERVDWTLEGAAGATLDGFSTGQSTKFATSRDQSGVASLEAQHEYQGARANVATTTSFRAEHALLGFYHATGPAQANVASVDTPTGNVACDCFFISLAPGQLQGPGDYTFHLSGAGAGGPPLYEYVLGLVDVDFP